MNAQQAYFVLLQEICKWLEENPQEAEGVLEPSPVLADLNSSETHPLLETEVLSV